MPRRRHFFTGFGTDRSSEVKILEHGWLGFINLTVLNGSITAVGNKLVADYKKPSIYDGCLSLPN